MNENLKKMTYKEAGVDINKEEITISSLISKLAFKRKGIGKPLQIKNNFTGLIDFGDYALSLCTDSVGSKVIIANALKNWKTVGIDCIAMSVNDMICVGAEPLAFVDYLALEEPNKRIAEEIGIGLSKGAKLSNITIIGGETATLPEVVNGFDLAGTCLGYVKKDKIITGENISIGDKIIGLRSSGIHSNGLTLARRVFENKGYSYLDEFLDSDKTIGEILLTPTKIYVKEILEVINKFNIKGLANITGGGLRNIKRLNKNVEFRITNPFEPQEIFKEMQKLGNIENIEMYQAFNMGMGFCLIVDKKEVNEILDLLKRKVEAKIVGEVIKGRGVFLEKF